MKMVNAMDVSNSPANSTTSDMQNINPLADSNGNGNSNRDSHPFTTLPREIELKQNLSSANADLILNPYNFTQMLTCAAKQNLNVGYRFGPYSGNLNKNQPNSTYFWKASFNLYSFKI